MPRRHSWSSSCGSLAPRPVRRLSTPRSIDAPAEVPHCEKSQKSCCSQTGCQTFRSRQKKHRLPQREKTRAQNGGEKNCSQTREKNRSQSRCEKSRAQSCEKNRSQSGEKSRASRGAQRRREKSDPHGEKTGCETAGAQSREKNER